jgi:hypothetical protein
MGTNRSERNRQRCASLAAITPKTGEGRLFSELPVPILIRVNPRASVVDPLEHVDPSLPGSPVSRSGLRGHGGRDDRRYLLCARGRNLRLPYGSGRHAPAGGALEAALPLSVRSSVASGSTRLLLVRWDGGVRRFGMKLCSRLGSRRTRPCDRRMTRRSRARRRVSRLSLPRSIARKRATYVKQADEGIRAPRWRAEARPTAERALVDCECSRSSQTCLVCLGRRLNPCPQASSDCAKSFECATGCTLGCASECVIE